LNGKGVAVNKQLGAHNLEIAARFGFAEAEFLFANCLALGEGVQQNLGLALEYMPSAARKGHPEARDICQGVDQVTSRRSDSGQRGWMCWIIGYAVPRDHE
jgi:TPR repeat protein